MKVSLHLLLLRRTRSHASPVCLTSVDFHRVLFCLAEIYFLVLRYLEAGPCHEAAKVRIHKRKRY